jgi:hypothetical protein
VRANDGYFDIDGVDRRARLDIAAMVAAAECSGPGVDPDPTTYEQAMRASDWPSWKAAIESEMNSQRKNGTFKKVVRTSGMKVIGSRLVFKKKMKNGVVERYKVRWVAQGFRQIQGVDYFETFAPTVKPASLRASLAIAACYLISKS